MFSVVSQASGIGLRQIPGFATTLVATGLSCNIAARTRFRRKTRTGIAKIKRLFRLQRVARIFRQSLYEEERRRRNLFEFQGILASHEPFIALCATDGHAAHVNRQIDFRCTNYQRRYVQSTFTKYIYFPLQL